MKKVISLIVLGISLIFLASCSKQNNLAGKYYNVYDGNAKLILEINGVAVNSTKKVLTLSLM